MVRNASWRFLILKRHLNKENMRFWNGKAACRVPTCRHFVWIQRVFSHPSQINNTYKLDLSAGLHPRNEEAKNHAILAWRYEPGQMEVQQAHKDKLQICPTLACEQMLLNHPWCKNEKHLLYLWSLWPIDWKRQVGCSQLQITPELNYIYIIYRTTKPQNISC